LSNKISAPRGAASVAARPRARLARDDSWKDCDWPERLREQIMEYNILDFSEWRDEDSFRRMFGRLLDGLDLFYK